MAPRPPIDPALQRFINGIVQAWVAPASIRVDDGDRPYTLQPFAGQGAAGSTTGNPLVLTGSGGATPSGSVSFQIPNDCEIEVDDWKATSSAITTATQPGAPLGFTVQVSWNGNQNQLTPNPLPAEFIFSTSNSFRSPWSVRPWIVTWRREMGGMPQASFSNLTFNCVNQLTTTNTIYFALLGWNRQRGG